MDVSAPSPAQAVAAARIALAEAMVLKVGQTLQAMVLGKGSDGLTELKIGDQVVTAKLAQTLAPGTTLQLQVKANGPTPQLAIVSQTPPGAVAPRVVAPAPVLAPAQNATPLLAPGVVVAAPVKVESLQQAAAVVSQNESSPATVGEPPRATAASTIEARPSVTVSALDRPQANVVPAASPNIASAAEAAQTRVVQASVPPTPTRTAPISASLASTPAPPVAARGLPSSPTGPQAVSVEAVAPGAQPAPTSAETALAPLPAAPAPPVSATVSLPERGPVPTPPVAPTIATAEPEPTASSPLLVAQAAPRPVATMADMPRIATPVVAPTAAVATPSQPTTPQAALAQMLPEALAKQDTAGPLLAALAAAVERPNLLPEPILRAALGVLAQRIVATGGKLPAAVLEAAVSKSGVLLEANLAKAEPQPGDAKAGLLALRNVLARFLGEAPIPSAARDAAPPPLKGLPLRAPAMDLGPLPDAPRDALRALHGQADAAVSRTKLMQLASLPDADPAKPSQPTLRMELPFLIGHELVMAQLQISREGARREVNSKRGWTMRFALNFSATGEVGAEVGLLGKAVNVALWAVEPETAEALNAALPELATALEALGLNPGAMRLRQGVPEPERPASGRLLDSVT